MIGTGANFPTDVVDLAGATLGFTRVGDAAGTPTLMLHGWPQTARSWNRVIPTLVEHGQNVLAVDLPGIGGSSPSLEGYDSDAIATILHRFIHAMGHRRLHVVGHDNGARIGYAYAALFPGEVASLTFVESKILGLEDPEDVKKEYWHFGFHQEPGLAEALTRGRIAEYLGYFFARTVVPGCMDADKESYIEAYSRGDAMTCGFEYYRAFPKTGEQSRAHARRKLSIPVLAYGGAYSMGEGPIRSMRLVATDVRGGVIPDGGHWIPDERPKWLADKIVSFHESLS